MPDGIAPVPVENNVIYFMEGDRFYAEAFGNAEHMRKVAERLEKLTKDAENGARTDEPS